MGVSCQVMTLGGHSELRALGENRVRQLEDSWTRFDDGSELSEFNSRGGHWQRVSPDLLELLVRGLVGWRLSGGAFDPFLARDIVKAGYDRDFSALSPSPTGQPATERASAVSDKGLAPTQARAQFVET